MDTLKKDCSKSYSANSLLPENDIFDNKLIFGDNLLALKALESEYRGKIKCIYIDPPYNTKQTFTHYKDKLASKKWLEFMRDRLDLLWALLKNDGFLAIQIDDNEYARLYLLMCELFGENNLKTICVKMSEASGVKMAMVKKYGVIPKLKEYIIIAKKDSVKNIHLDLIPKNTWDKEYNIFLNNFSRDNKKRIDEISLSKNITNANIQELDNIAKNIERVAVSKKIKELGLKGQNKHKWLLDNAFRICRTNSSEFVLKLIQSKKQLCNQNVFFISNKKNCTLYMVNANYSIDAKKPRVQIIFAEDNLGKHPGDLWTDIQTAGLDSEGDVEFKNGKKPEKLIARIIKMATNKGDIVLDAFAGSGTTGAVAHKMGRKWIMIENGTHCNTHIIPRLKNVIDGTDQSGISKSVTWKGGGGFNYYAI